MFQMKNDMQTAVKHNIRGGDGSPSFRYLFSAEQLGNRAEMMAVITLRPGESVGWLFDRIIHGYPLLTKLIRVTILASTTIPST